MPKPSYSPKQKEEKRKQDASVYKPNSKRQVITDRAAYGNADYYEKIRSGSVDALLGISDKVPSGSQFSSSSDQGRVTGWSNDVKNYGDSYTAKSNAAKITDRGAKMKEDREKKRRDREALRDRKQAAESYMSEQEALLNASKEREERRKEAARKAAASFQDEQNVLLDATRPKMTNPNNGKEEPISPAVQQDMDAYRKYFAGEGPNPAEANKVPATPFRSDKPSPAEHSSAYDDFNAWDDDEDDEDGVDEIEERGEEEDRSDKFTREQYEDFMDRSRELANTKITSGEWTLDRANEFLRDQKRFGESKLIDEPEQPAYNPLTDFLGRAGNTVAGASEQYASGVVNTAGTAITAMGEIGGQYGNASPYAGYAVDPMSAAVIGNGTPEEQRQWAEDMQAVQNYGGTLEQTADMLGDKAAQNLAEAKAGLGTIGQGAVDVATNLIQMGFDAALGKIPGVSSLAAMYIRTAGSSAQEGRQKGATTGQQIGYGLVKGAIETATEKLFDGVARVYGAGSFDDIVEGAVKKLAKSGVGDAGLSLFRAAVGAGGEGLEEVFSDIFSPLAETIINDQTLYSLFFDANGRPFKGSYSLNASEVLYDFLIGSIIGAVGGGTSIVTGQSAAQNAEARYMNTVDERVDAQMNGVMDALLGNPPTQPAQSFAGENQTVSDSGTGTSQPQSSPELLADVSNPEPKTAPAPQPTETAPEANPTEEMQPSSETPTEAAESVSPEGNESVPESTQESTTQASDELNNGSGQTAAEGSTMEADNDSIPSRISALKDQLKGLKPFTREYEAVEHDIHNYYWQLVSSAKDHIDALNRFGKNPNADVTFYDSAEDAQAQYDEAINGLREAGLPPLKDLRQKAHWVEERIDWAQRQLEKLYDKVDAEGRSQLTEQEAEDVQYFEDTQVKAKNESEELNEVCDFLEEHYSDVYGKKEAKGEGVLEKDTAKLYDREDGRHELESDERGSRTDQGKIQENDTGRTESLYSGDAKRESDKDAEAEKRERVAAQHARGRSEVISQLPGGAVELDVENLPRQYSDVKTAIDNAKADAPDCNFIVVKHAGDIAWHQKGTGTIVVDPERALQWAKDATRESGVKQTVDNLIRHEKVHYWFDESSYTASEIIRHVLSDFANDADAMNALKAAYDEHALKYHPGSKPNDLWEEVLADLDSGIVRAFTLGDGIDPAFERLQASASKYIRRYVVDTYEENNGIIKKPNSGKTEFSSKDPGENKSYRDSLFANEPAEQEDTGERPDDDMTPLNEQSREQDEKEREQSRKDTEKKMGKETHKRLTEFQKKLSDFAKTYTERYGKTVRDENGRKVKDENDNEVKESFLDELAKNVGELADGRMTVQQFNEFFQTMKPGEGENKATDQHYFYDEGIAAVLNQFANAERDLIFAERDASNESTTNPEYEKIDPDIANENYKKAAEIFTRVFETVETRLQDNFDGKPDSRVKLNEEITANARKEGRGYAEVLNRAIERYKRAQFRPDTFFKALGGFSEKLSPGLYKVAERAKASTKKLINVRNNAKQFFYDISSGKDAKAYRNFENGKTKGTVEMPGFGKPVSLNYEMAILKTLETNGALDHIARFGAEFADEADYYSGLNNNGWGSTERAKIKWSPEALDQMAKENLQASQLQDDLLGSKPKKITGKDIYDEKIRILKDLRKELKNDVMSSEIGRSVYEASVKAMQYMADELNETTLTMYGVAKALQGSNYWPMEVIGRGNNAQIMNNMAFNMEAQSFLQHRQGGSGALHIRPFTEAMSSYIDRASNFTAFGELSSDLNMMTKEIEVGHGEHDAEKQSIQSVLKKQVGSEAGKWMENWMGTLNGKPRKNSFGTKMRGRLAQSSLMMNFGVAFKQSPSYYNAMGIIDPDILLKSRLLNAGPIRSAKSYDNNPLLQTVNEKTSILKSRKVGENVVEMGEAVNSGRSLSGKILGKCPKWLTNWINKTDYRTVANLGLACAEQVKRNNPSIDTNSDEYYQKVADLFEEVVVASQPIYDAQFRPEYLRSDNEIVRALSMFRTQQSQNFNQLMIAFGENAAAKKSGDEAAMKQTSEKLRHTVAGYVTSQTAFALLSSAAKMLLHKQKDYEDEDGQLDIGKIGKRLGLDFFSSFASITWFGDVAAKVIVDSLTGLASNIKGKDGKPIVEKTSEFYGLADNTISTIDSMLSGLVGLAQNRTPKTLKTALFNVAQFAGLPLRNLYNLANSAVMYGMDISDKFFGTNVNLGNYDDIVDKFQTQGRMSDGSRAKQTTEAALGYYGKGDRKRAETLLATLDYSDSKVVSAVKTALNDAYVAGKVDELTYRGILRNYVGMSVKDIGEQVDSKNLDKTIAALTESDPEKYKALVKQIDEAKDKPEDYSKAEAAARTILDGGYSNDAIDAMIQKHTGSTYSKAYSALRGTYKPNMAVDLLAGVDKDKNDSFTQDELWNYYLDNPGSEKLMKTVWDVNGWSTSWDNYKASKQKTAAHDALVRENEGNYQFGAAEKRLSALKKDAGIYLQKANADRDMYKIIRDMDITDSDKDIVVDKYVSAKNRKSYHILRNSGLSSNDSFKMLDAVDKDENGSLKQEELWKYYKKHPEQEAYVKALWNAMGYKKDWKTYKKSQKK